MDDSIYYIKNYGPGSVVWKHWVNVWVPKDRKIDKELLDSAILFIDGGGNSSNEKPPRSAEQCTIVNSTILDLIIRFKFKLYDPKRTLIIRSDRNVRFSVDTFSAYFSLDDTFVKIGQVLSSLTGVIYVSSKVKTVIIDFKT